MAAESVAQRINALSITPDTQELAKLFNTLIDALRTVTVKLDNDAGVTDTNYTALFDAIIVK